MATIKIRTIKCEWCGTAQDVNVNESDRLGAYKCKRCNQSLARMVARDIILNK